MSLKSGVSSLGLFRSKTFRLSMMILPMSAPERSSSASLGSSGGRCAAAMPGDKRTHRSRAPCRDTASIVWRQARSLTCIGRILRRSRGSWKPRMCAQYAVQGVNDPFDVSVLHRGQERQGEDIAAGVFGMREVAGFEAEALIQREEMDRRIVHPGTNAGGVHFGHHLRALHRQALLGKHDLEHVPVAVHEVRTGQLQAKLGNAALLKARKVGARERTAARIEGG